MDVINQPNNEILFLMGKNPFFRNQKYRLNKYCFIHDYDNVKLILNEMTRSLVSITNEEFEKIYDLTNVYKDEKLEYIEFLIENYFLVLEDYDEASVIDKIREFYRPKIDDNYLKEAYDFIIYPTTTCNARCFYCYEKPMSNKKPMSLETAEIVSKYIMKKAPNKNNEIILRWFGGEPLYNMKAMRHIIKRLKEEGFSYKSTIVSNGYLFSDKIVEEAVNEWHLQHAQITLDGTEEVYNKAKNYIYTNQDKVSPFKKVIDNIDKLTSNGIGVDIRMNTDMYNVEDLKNLVKLLDERFPEHKNLGVYCYPIFEDDDKPRTDEEKRELFNKLWELEDVMKECNFIIHDRAVPNQIRATHCMVDNGNTINIHPDGKLGLCEHYIDEDFWGHIDENSEEIRDDWNVVLEWRDYLTDDFCKNCKIYPTCIRTRKCHDLRKCDEFMQEFRYKHEAHMMESVYKEHINGNYNNGNLCYCVSQVCDQNTSNNQDYCYCVGQVCDTNTQNNCHCVTQNTNVNSDICNCVSQYCDKENWCYCISQKPTESEHKCEGGTCSCKKEEKEKEEEEVIEIKENKTILSKLKDLFK